MASIFYIYLGTAHDLVKVGMTEDLHRRCSQHRSSNPVFKLFCFAEGLTPLSNP